MVSTLEENEDYLKGYEDGITAQKDVVVDAYYDGYRRGYRDARKEHSEYRWYSGIMFGIVGVILGGITVYMTGTQPKSVDIVFGKR